MWFWDPNTLAKQLSQKLLRDVLQDSNFELVSYSLSPISRASYPRFRNRVLLRGARELGGIIADLEPTCSLR